MSTSALVVVAARTGSTRLPGKVLADLAGMPMLELQLRRLLPLTTRTDARIVVATTDLAADDPVAALADELGVAVVRGAADDVLGRFSIALVRHPSDLVVRLGADSPLTDPFVVGAAIDLHRAAEADYTSNTLPRSYPQGLDVEVLSARALRAAELEADDPVDVFAAGREHEHGDVGARAELPQDLEAVRAREHHVEYDHREPAGLRLRESLEPVVHRTDAEPLGAQVLREELGELDVVVDHEQVRFGHGASRVYRELRSATAKKRDSFFTRIHDP